MKSTVLTSVTQSTFLVDSAARTRHPIPSGVRSRSGDNFSASLKVSLASFSNAWRQTQCRAALNIGYDWWVPFSMEGEPAIAATYEQELLGVQGQGTSIKHCKTIHTKQKTQRPCYNAWSWLFRAPCTTIFQGRGEESGFMCVFPVQDAECGQNSH